MMEWKDFWPDLPVETKKQFEAQSQIIELKRGENVYRQGDMPRGLYFVDKGLVGLVLIGENSGKEHLMRFFRQGQFFGHRSLFSDEGYHGTAMALEATRLKLLPKNVVFLAIEKDPSLLKGVTRTLAKEFRCCENHQVAILENEVLPRIAQALVFLKDLHPEHNWTRQEIASFCASTVSTVIKTLSEIEKMGFIKQDGRTIETLDRDALIELQDI